MGGQAYPASAPVLTHSRACPAAVCPAVCAASAPPLPGCGRATDLRAVMRQSCANHVPDRQQPVAAPHAQLHASPRPAGKTTLPVCTNALQRLCPAAPSFPRGGSAAPLQHAFPRRSPALLPAGRFLHGSSVRTSPPCQRLPTRLPTFCRGVTAARPCPANFFLLTAGGQTSRLPPGNGMSVARRTGCRSLPMRRGATGLVGKGLFLHAQKNGRHPGQDSGR